MSRLGTSERKTFSASSGVKAKDYNLADARALFGEYRPHIKDFFFSGQQGRFMLDVSDTTVTVTAYGGDHAEVSRTFTLRT